MKIIRNNIIPFRGFSAMNLFGFLFCRKNAVIGSVTINHESIHTAQMKEMLYIPFYIWYGMEWLVRLMIYWNSHYAYRMVSFEQEAHANEQDMQYLKNRKHYSWFNYIFGN